MDQGGSAILVLLDLSALFDTVSPSLLLQRLHQAGLRDTVLALMESFLPYRSYIVSCGLFRSGFFQQPCRVPQGSWLSLSLFNLYVAPLAKLIWSCGFQVLSYVDDTQIIVSIADDVTVVAERFKQCMVDINNCMKENWLK